MAGAGALQEGRQDVRVNIERTFLTSPEGTRLISPEMRKFVVEALGLREAILEFISREEGRVLGTITESPQRAVCTGWTGGRLYVIEAQPAAD
jgi:hypothetical protein